MHGEFSAFYGLEIILIQTPCLSKSEEFRVIEGLSNTGEKEIIDELPPNEYSINERLPPLKPQVGRYVINVNFKPN